MENLTGQVAIVTGAVRGIGKAVAQQLMARGASVMVGYIEDEATAAAAVAELQEGANGGKVVGFYGNIADLKVIEDMFETCKKELGAPDIFVGNAGANLPRKPMLEHSEADFNSICDVNFKGTFFCMKKAGEVLKDGGRIIIVSSSTVSYPVDGHAVYTGTKAALEAVVEIAAMELGHRGITVNSVAPGVTVTNMSQAVLTPEFIDQVTRETPLRRIGQPVDVARVIAYLCEKDSQWISGQHITANGGSKY
jgi:3-oxoacyl-[acyl-carrier protein] reductase